MKPLVEIGFMPEALSTKPEPYRHDWSAGPRLQPHLHGLDLSAEGLRQVARADHAAGPRTPSKRYGQREVESWYWEVWNEPDIGYWQGTPEEYQKLYDYAADGLKRALPTARIGGPHVTGPNGARTQGIPPGVSRALPARHELRDRQDRLAARLRRLSRQGRAAVSSTATSAWASATSSARSPTASASSRRSPSCATRRSSSASPIRKGAPRAAWRRIRRTPTATARCIRATPRSSSRGPTSWPTPTRSTCAAR